MAKKYDIDIRGCDVKVMSKLWFGPWHSTLHGVYTMDEKSCLWRRFARWMRRRVDNMKSAGNQFCQRNNLRKVRRYSKYSM